MIVIFLKRIVNLEIFDNVVFCVWIFYYREGINMVVRTFVLKLDLVRILILLFNSCGIRVGWLIFLNFRFLWKLFYFLWVV